MEGHPPGKQAYRNHMLLKTFLICNEFTLDNTVRSYYMVGYSIKDLSMVHTKTFLIQVNVNHRASRHTNQHPKGCHMKIRTQYFLTFLSATLLTVILAATGWWGFSSLQKSTDYLVKINSSVLEYSSLFEKVLAQSRRAEKEFFIFPDNLKKQEKYVTKWNNSYNQIYTYITELQKLFVQTGNTAMLADLKEAEKAMLENEKDFAIVVEKFRESKSYNLVNAAEYGIFKNRTHTIEDISAAMTQFGLKEVQKGRAELAATQNQLLFYGKIITLTALLSGIIIPFILSKRLTAYILQLTNATTHISRGDLAVEMPPGRKDELGDLANAIELIRKSLKIMLKKASKN